MLVVCRIFKNVSLICIIFILSGFRLICTLISIIWLGPTSSRLIILWCYLRYLINSDILIEELNLTYMIVLLFMLLTFCFDITRFEWLSMSINWVFPFIMREDFHTWTIRGIFINWMPHDWSISDWITLFMKSNHHFRRS